MTPSSLSVLAIGSHPDDVELLCGGFLLQQKSLGHSIGVIDLTQGELGSRGTTETRAKESAAAAKVLGLSHRQNLNLPDGGISGTETNPLDDKSQTARVVAVLRELKPEIVVVPYWEDRHPDHVETSKLLTRAIFYAGLRNYPAGKSLPAYQPKQTLYYPIRYDVAPSMVVDTTPFFQKKLEAIACYSSQVTPSSDTADKHVLMSAPLNLKALEARDRYTGALIGVEFGEGFVTRSPILIRDAVKHFRESDTSTALLFRSRGS